MSGRRPTTTVAAPAQHARPTPQAAARAVADGDDTRSPAAKRTTAKATTKAANRPATIAARAPQPLLGGRVRIAGVTDADAGYPATDIGTGVAISVAAFVLYAFTAAHYQVTGDTPELMAVAKILGVAHAPGYPLLTMAGHVVGWLPIGSYAYRLSLFSAACSAVCVGVVYATVRRLTPHRASAACAAVALALTPVFWQWSLQFEVFALANLLAVATTYLLVCWYQQPRRAGFLIGAAFVVGLGMTNQQTIALLVPAIGWLLWLRRQALLDAPRVVGYCVLALAAGFLPYIYVPIAASHRPGLSWDDARTATNMVNLLTRKDYGSGLHLIAGGSYAGGNPIVRLGYLAAGVGFVVGLLALAGLYRAYREQRWYFWFVLLAFGFTGVIFELIANLDTSAPSALFVLGRFLLLPLVLVAPLAGLGATQLAELLAGRARTPERTIRFVTVVIIVVAAVVASLNYGRIDLRSDRVADRYARDVLSGLPAHDILLVNGDETLAPVWYARYVEGVRPDVTVVLSTGLVSSWYDDELRTTGLAVPTGANLLAFREANIGRPMNIVGASPDTSLQGKFYVYQDGLTNDLIAQAVNKSTTELVADNDAKLASYHIPSYRTVKARSFEPAILADYASVPYAVGNQFKELKDDADALTWFQKALAIDPSVPTFQQAVAALRK